MKKLTVIAALALASVTNNASAQTLWSNLSYGMPQAEVKALYPIRGLTGWPTVQLTAECKGELSFEYDKDKKLNKVIMEWSAKDKGPCAEVVEQTLLAKYGQPTSEDRGQRKDVMECRDRTGLANQVCEATLDQYKIVKKWKTADGVEMRLRRYNDTVRNWKIEWYVPIGASDDAAKNL